MRIADRIIEAIMAATLAALVLIAFIAVVFRYALNSALSWSFEVSLILLTYLTFIGCYAAMRRNAHLKVEVLAERLPLGARAPVFVLAELAVLLVCVVMVVWGSQQMLMFATNTTLMLGMPRGPIYAIIPLSGLAMGADTLVRLVVGIRRMLRGEPPTMPEADVSAEI